jgi:hypothetical protein
MPLNPFKMSPANGALSRLDLIMRPRHYAADGQCVNWTDRFRPSFMREQLSPGIRPQCSSFIASCAIKTDIVSGRVSARSKTRQLRGATCYRKPITAAIRTRFSAFSRFLVIPVAPKISIRQSGTTSNNRPPASVRAKTDF